MLIPVTFNPPSSQSTPTLKLPAALAKISHDEVVLIELQGALEVEVAQPTDKNGKLVGKLTIDENGSVSQPSDHKYCGGTELFRVCKRGT